MARTVFKDAIDYSKVKIHRGGLLGQPNRSGNAMTPRGEIHFPDDDYRTDFSIQKADAKIWFIHEMAHVWQYQLGYNLIWNGIKIGASGGYNSGAPAYRYDLREQDKGKRFSAFNMEQQGELIAHYYAATQLKIGKYIEELPDLTLVLSDFLSNPKNPNLLPTTTDF